MNTSFGTSQVPSLGTSTSSESRCCSESETELAVREGDIVEEEGIVLDFDDIALQLKLGNKEELRHALLVLQDLISSNHVTHEWIEKYGIVFALCNRLSYDEADNRLNVLRILRALISDDNVKIKAGACLPSHFRKL